MLFNAHNFCGMANHFSMLGLGKSGKITKKCGQHFLQILLREEGTEEQRGHEKVFVSLSGCTCPSLCETEGSSVCLVALRASGHWDDD